MMNGESSSEGSATYSLFSREKREGDGRSSPSSARDNDSEEVTRGTVHRTVLRTGPGGDDEATSTGATGSSSASSAQRRQARGISFSEHQVQQQMDMESVHASPTAASQTSRDNSNNSNSNNTSVPTEQERQILLLMLLAQVCALHDPTPRTFTVHVLELFERGILDRQSIHFLFELGLVPNLNASSQPKLLTAQPTSAVTAPSPTDIPTTTSDLVAPPSGQQFLSHPHHHFVRQRSLEVSAIRSTLEHQEKLHSHCASAAATSPTGAAAGTTTTTPNHSSQPQQPVSWSAEHHPLSLSRYQREFKQLRLLSSGSFGHVFQATNKTDGQDYAVKRVPFVAAGYSNESVQQVTREVQCLAACDHPHVVRFYTSWLEPSWMTGSGGSTSKGAVPSVLQTPLLTNGMAMARITKKEGSPSTTARSRRRPPLRRFSFDKSDRSASWRSIDSGEEESSGVSLPDHYFNGEESDIFDRSSPAESKSVGDDSYLDNLLGRGKGVGEHRSKHTKPSKTQQQSAYRYQICLFIQMQLCNPSTLADWIRARNRKIMEQSTVSATATTTRFAERMRPAMQIFEQICSGLAHVHHKGIVHRDLKPANIFASKDGSTFLIGDFGLSKLLQRKTWGDRNIQPHTTQDRLMLMHQPSHDNVADEDFNSSRVQEPSWTDPLTAGVGTASYASPEQVASRSYGKEADIFSLGLILLELLCCFSTEHERLQTFHNCRYRRDLPAELHSIPAIGDIILQCTDKSPANRPTADSLRMFAQRLLSSNVDTERSDEEQFVSQVEQLQLELSERNQEVRELKATLAEKDQIIKDLQLQLSVLRQATIQNRTVVFAGQSEIHESAEEPFYRERSESCSSSSTDHQI